ncbi:hypothetical protein HMPREF1549_01206 [Actinomyces johnsonii F0510]|uniref:Uncharacterized protein n=1 Tax=Actinomyces johnsonii F0510 TaxID=1227262 RepID=U1RPU3_9ACTO|nr:hypothetical protein HMPREF1549_01206 [Actinomyces johnsonii F0510]
MEGGMLAGETACAGRDLGMMLGGRAGTFPERRVKRDGVRVFPARTLVRVLS